MLAQNDKICCFTYSLPWICFFSSLLTLTLTREQQDIATLYPIQ